MQWNLRILNYYVHRVQYIVVVLEWSHFIDLQREIKETTYTLREMAGIHIFRQH